jgi:hypothetical protein
MLAAVDALMIISWFRTGATIDYAEDGLAYAVWGFTLPNLYPASWMAVRAMGSTLPFGPTGFAWSWEQFLISLLALGNPVVREAITFYIIIYLQGSFTYLLTEEITDGRALPSIIAAFAYVLSPYIMVFPWKRFLMPEIMFSALLPIAAYLFLRGIASGRILRYSSLLAISTFLLGFSFGMPPMVLTLWVFLALLALSSALVGYYALRSLKMFITSFALFLLTGAYWILPYAGLIRASVALASARHLYSQLMSGIPPLFGIRLIYPTGANITTTYNLVYLWGSYYSSVLLIAATFLIPILAFLPVMLLRNKKIDALAIVALVGLFFIFGTSPPTGGAYAFLINHVWILRLWGNGVMEDAGYIAALPYAVLFGVGAAAVAEWLRTRSRRHGVQIEAAFLVALIILDMALLPMPMWTGAVFTDIFNPTHSPFQLYPPARAPIPQYYQQANDYLSSGTGDGYRILVLPFVNFGSGIAYNLSGTPYAGGSRWALFPSMSSIYASDLMEPVDALTSLAPGLMINNSGSFVSLLQMLGVRYVVVVPTIPEVNSELANDVLSGHGVTVPTSIAAPSLGVTVPTSIAAPSLGVTVPSSTAAVSVPIMPISMLHSSGVWGPPVSFSYNDTSVRISFYNSSSGFQVPLRGLQSNWSGLTYLSFYAKSNVTGTLYMQLWNSSNYFAPVSFTLIPGKDVYLIPGIGGGLTPYYAKGDGEVFVPLNPILPERANMSHLVFGFAHKGLAYLEISNLTVGVPSSTAKILTGVRGISYAKSFGQLDLYRVEDPLPMIFASARVIGGANASNMSALLESGEFNPHAIALVNAGGLSISGTAPSVSFTSTPLGYYVVRVSNASGPFLLVLNQDYDASWMLAKGNLDVFQQLLAGDAYQHVEVDGYMNGWLINGTANGTYTIYYAPNDLGILGEIISISSVTILILVVMSKQVLGSHRDVEAHRIR